MEGLELALLKLSPKNGDIVFVDRNVVNADALIEMQSPSADQDDVMFVFVDVRPNQAMKDAILAMPRAELVELLKPLNA